LFWINVKDVSVLAVARAARIAHLRRDSGNLAQQRIEESATLVTMASLLFEATKLHREYCALPFAQAIVRAIDIVAVEPFAGHAATIVNRARLALEGVIIGDNHASFAGRHQFAGLKAEGGSGPECSNLRSTPLAAMSVSRIFDQMDFVALCNFSEAIEVGRMPAHVNGDDGLRTRRNRRLGEIRIETVAPGIHLH